MGSLNLSLDISQTLQEAIFLHKAGKLNNAEQLYRSIISEQANHPDANHNLGVLLKQGDKIDIALPFFKTALEANPKQGQYWISYIDTLIHFGQYDAAQNLLNQGQAKGLKGDAVDQLRERLNSKLKSAPESVGSLEPPKAQVDALIALYSQGQVQEALRSSEALIRDHPNTPLLYNISGACYQAIGQLERAVKSFEQALAIKPDYSEAQNNLGITLKELGQLEAAVKSYEQALATKPDNANAHYNLGNTLKELGQLEKAVKCYEQALVIKPDYPKAQCNLGNTLKELGQLEAAVKSYEQALVINPDYTEVHYNLGNTLKEIGQLEKAVKCYEQAIAINPEYADAHYNLGNTLQELGQLEKVVKCYEYALAIKPDYAKAQCNLGNTYLELGQLEKAVKCYEQALAIKPDYPKAQCNLGNTLKELGQLEAAVKSYEQALVINPDYTEVYYNLGNTLKEIGQLEKAVKCYEQAITINPEYADAQCNLGNTLQDLGQLESAVKHYEKALVIKSDYAEVYSNLGAALQGLGQLEKAVKSYERALAIKPDTADVHYNLGITYKELGQLEKAVNSYEQALAIKPNYAKAWESVFFIAKVLDFSSTQHIWLDSYKKNLDAAVLNNIHFKILDYRLNAFIPHTVDDCFNEVINTLPLISHEEIQNPSPIGQNKEPPAILNNMIALLHFGRSGTGLLHSLIDNHPKISTLPSIYFSEYFNEDVWGKLIAQGWDQLPENFINQFTVLFDARSSVPVPAIDKPIANLGQKEGMANVGINRDEVLTVDQNRFCAELRKLMTDYPSLTSQTFFTLVHAAYEKTLNKSSNKQIIFYHIHNPGLYAKLNFLRYNPEAKLLMMVREPIQNCESWLKKEIKKSSQSVHNRIVTMLFDIDQIAFRRQDSIGVRLEDLKARPKATMAGLCAWMGIEENPTLYEMTAQGKKWWGDPSSPDYSPEGMSPFDDSAITRKVGSVFNEQDQFILRTLFYPFSVRFGYVAENITAFKEDLKAIKPLLDEPFGFQEQLAENLSQDLDTITRSGSALYFRAALHDRWAVLNEFNDYPHMLKPLVIQES